MDKCSILTDFLKKGIDSFLKYTQEKRSYIETAKQLLHYENDLPFEKDILDQIFNENTIVDLFLELKVNGSQHDMGILFNKLSVELESKGLDTFSASIVSLWYIKKLILISKKSNNQILNNVSFDGIASFLDNKSASIFELTKNAVEIFSKSNMDASALKCIGDIDNQIYNSTIYPSLNLDFFKLDDDDFHDALTEKIDDEAIFIVGHSHEEALLYVLKDLRDIECENRTFIVKSNQIWERLKEIKVKGLILIPYFFDQDVAPIPGNTTIFISNYDENIQKDNCIELRKRTIRSYRDAFQEYGYSSEDSYKYPEKTNGIYFALKEKIFTGRIAHPFELQMDKSHLAAAIMLCGKWVSGSEDISLIKEMVGKTESEIEDFLATSCFGEYPLLVRRKRYGTQLYELSCAEDIWSVGCKFVTESMWDKFSKLFVPTLLSNNASKILKHGIVNSLLMMKYVARESYQKDTSEIVSNLFEAAQQDRWSQIADFIPDLFEVDPQITLCYLKRAVETSNDSFISLFETGQYTNVIYAIEKGFALRNHVYGSIDLLWHMLCNEKIGAIKLIYTNGPKESLRSLLCAWYNVSVLSPSEKNKVIKEALNQYDCAWDVLISILPGKQDNLLTSGYSTEYISSDEKVQPTRSDIYKLYSDYVSLAVEYAKNDVDKWLKLVEIPRHVDDVIFNCIITNLEQAIATFDDVAKFKIKESLRREISNNREHANTEWACDENRLAQYEAIMNKIRFSKPECEYAYLFTSLYSFPLLHPVVFNANNSYFEENEKKSIVEIQNEIGSFKEKGLSLVDLLKFAEDVHKNNNIGYIISKFYDESSFSAETFTALLNSNVSPHEIYQYLYFCYEKDTGFYNDCLTLIRENSRDDKVDVLIEAYKVEATFDYVNYKQYQINDEDDSIKIRFWGTAHFNVSNNIEKNVWMLDQAFQFGTVHLYGWILYSIKDSLATHEVYLLLSRLSTVRDEFWQFVNSDAYLLTEIEKVIIDSLNDNQIEELARLEFKLREQLEWKDMICLKKYLCLKPDFYAEMIEDVYLKEGERRGTIAREHKFGNSIFGFLTFKVHFCPAEENGYVDGYKLKEWCEDLKELLKKQKQDYLYKKILGSLFANAPKGEDSYYPCESVRDVIELEYNDELQEAYRTQVFNNRGAVWVDAGKPEKRLSLKYQENADGIREKYPNTALIYDCLAKDYLRESVSEREIAEYEL